MSVQITGKQMDLTEAIKAHIEKRVSEFEKYGFELIHKDVEVDKNKHHNKGEDVFHVRMNIHVPHEQLFAEVEKHDLYAAVDECRDEIERQMRKLKSKYDAKERKAQKTRRSVKDILTFWK